MGAVNWTATIEHVGLRQILTIALLSGATVLARSKRGARVCVSFLHVQESSIHRRRTGDGQDVPGLLDHRAT